MRYLARRASEAVLTLLLVSIVVFAAGRAIGDPLDLLLPPNASPEQVAHFEEKLDLDGSLPDQYVRFLGDSATGDLGTSVSSGQPVADTIQAVLPQSLRLAAVSMGFALAIGLPLGILSAVRRGTVWDVLARLVAVVGQSVPSFVLGLLLMLLLAVNLGWLPTSGTGDWRNYVMPGLSMGLILGASITRLMRTSMIEVMSSEYVKMHRAMGIPERRVVWKYAARNACISVIGFAAVYIVILVTNAVVIETVFNWPGFGRLAYDAVLDRDYPMIQGVVLVGTVLYVLSSFAADALSALANPRLRAHRS
jgi:peptide/nickel transport system permease protein